jgi:hypothetical protein
MTLIQPHLIRFWDERSQPAAVVTSIIKLLRTTLSLLDLTAALEEKAPVVE